VGTFAIISVACGHAFLAPRASTPAAVHEERGLIFPIPARARHAEIREAPVRVNQAPSTLLDAVVAQRHLATCATCCARGNIFAVFAPLSTAASAGVHEVVIVGAIFTKCPMAFATRVGAGTAHLLFTFLAAKQIFAVPAEESIA
jgi:hypothetical protein